MHQGRVERAVRFFFALVDAAALCGAWLLAMEVRFGAERGHIDQTAYAWTGAGLMSLALVIFYILELYDLRHPLTSQVARMVYGIGMSVGILMVSVFFLRYAELSRLTIVYYFALANILAPLGRVAAYWIARSLFKKGYASVNCLVLGSSPRLDEVRKYLSKHPEYRYRIVAPGEELKARLAELERGELTDEGARELKALLREANIRCLFVEELDREKLKRLMYFCQEAYLEVYVVPDLAALVETSIEVGRVGNIPLLKMGTVRLFGPQGKIKRIVDFAGAAVGLILCLPLFVVIGLWVALDSPGPVFFRHTRLGLGGRTFEVIKFRTMVKDAQSVLQKYLEENAAAREQFEAEYKLRDDPRVTRAGRFLRRTSLDELPQLWNVLKGEMSLVGPRPIVPDELRKYGDDARFLLRVPPGMTGLWQVNGRNDVSYEERVKLDMYYIQNWSLWLDLSILVRTIPAVLKSKGAY